MHDDRPVQEPQHHRQGARVHQLVDQVPGGVHGEVAVEHVVDDRRSASEPASSPSACAESPAALPLATVCWQSREIARHWTITAIVPAACSCVASHPAGGNWKPGPPGPPPVMARSATRERSRGGGPGRAGGAGATFLLHFEPQCRRRSTGMTTVE